MNTAKNHTHRALEFHAQKELGDKISLNVNWR
jgi:hypothetical protein